MNDMSDGAARFAHKKEQDRQRQRRHRAKTNPRPNGPQRISITIQDPETWRAVCGASERESLVAMTEDNIDNACREYRKKQASEQLEKLSKTRTGIMDREAAVATLDANGEWTITSRREPPPGKPRVKPNDMTDEQWELVMEQWRDEYEDLVSRMSDADNPESGEWRRVNTRHNWERDR